MSHTQQFDRRLELVEYFSVAIVSELKKSRKQFAALCSNTKLYIFATTIICKMANTSPEVTTVTVFLPLEDQ